MRGRNGAAGWAPHGANWATRPPPKLPVWPGHDNNFRAGLASPARHGHQLGQWLVDMLTIAVEQDIDRRPPAGTASRQSIRI